MSTPPKIAVFVFVLTIHLAILAFAFPRLELSDPAQSSAAGSPAVNAESASTEAASHGHHSSSAESNQQTSPVQHHQPEDQQTKQSPGEKRSTPVVPHDLHQHSLADNNASRATPADREAPTLAPLPEPGMSKPDKTLVEPGAKARPALKAVSLPRTERPEVSADPVSIPKPKPESKPVAVRRPSNQKSNKAGSSRMNNLRPLKDGGR